MSSDSERFRAFDGFKLDLESRVLWHEGQLLTLPPKAVNILIELTERPGDVMSKDALMDLVWGDAFVEEGNLSNNIYLLRKTLGAAGGRQYIETVPRRGYRFVGDVEEIVEHHKVTIDRTFFAQAIIEEISEEPAVETSLADRTVGDIGRERQSSIRRPLVAALGMLIAIVGVGYASWQAIEARNGGAAAGIRKIAVLPLSSEGGADDSIRLRIADAIATRFAETDSLVVRSTASLVAYDIPDRDPLEIGRQLDVDAVVDGRIQAEGDRLRVNLYLVEVRSGDYLWSGQFDGRADRLLALQDAIAAKMIADLGLKFERRRNIASAPPTENAEAYEHYIRGRFRFYKRGTVEVDKAREHFEKAIELDPNFIEAKIGLANVLAFNPIHRKGIDKLLNELMAADPSRSQIYAIRGFVSSFHDWNWEAGEREFITAIELDPNNALARQWYANNLMVRSRYLEAETQLKRALDLDPTSVPILSDTGQLYSYWRRFDDAEYYLSQANSMQGDNVTASSYLAHVLATRQRDERLRRGEARFSKEEAELIDGWDNMIDQIKERDGEKHVRVSEYIRLAAYMAAVEHDRETTLAKIGELVAMRNFMLPFQLSEPFFDFIRDDPDFISILRTMNLQN